MGGSVTVLEATQAELEALAAVDTSRGQMALVLARALDSGRGLDALAGMVKQHELTMQAIRDLKQDEGADSVDESAAATEEKLRLVR